MKDSLINNVSAFINNIVIPIFLVIVSVWSFFVYRQDGFITSIYLVFVSYLLIASLQIFCGLVIFSKKSSEVRWRLIAEQIVNSGIIVFSVFLIVGLLRKRLFIHFNIYACLTLLCSLVYCKYVYFRKYDFLKNRYYLKVVSNIKSISGATKLLLVVFFIVTLAFLFVEKFLLGFREVQLMSLLIFILLGLLNLIVNYNFLLNEYKKLYTRVVIKRSSVFSRKWVWFLLVFGFGTLFRVLYTFCFYGYGADENQYYYDAYLTSEGLTPLKDFHSRAIPFIYLFSFFVRVFGTNVVVGRLFTLVCSLITAIFLYKIGKLVFNQKVAFIAALLFLYIPAMWRWNALLVTEVPEMCLLTVAAYCFIKALLANKKWLLFINGLLILVAILIRSSAFIILAVEGLILLLYLIKKKDTFGSFIGKGLRILLGLFGIPAVLGIVLFVSGRGEFASDIVMSNLNITNLINKLIEPSYDKRQDFALISWNLEVLSKNLMIIIFPFIVLIYEHVRRFIKGKKGEMWSRVFIALFFISCCVFASYYNLEILVWLFILLLIINWKSEFFKSSDVSKVFFFVLMPFGLALIYLIQPRMEPIYFYEFIPWLCVLAGLFFYRLLKSLFYLDYEEAKKPVLYIALSFILITVGFFYYFNSYIEGQLKYSTLEKIRKIEEVRENKEIFTGSVLIASHVNKKIPYNISHPTAYYYEWISDDYLHKIGYPTIEELKVYLIKNKVDTLYIEEDRFQTKEYYFENNPDFWDFIRDYYYIDQIVDNVYIYRLKDPTM